DGAAPPGQFVLVEVGEGGMGPEGEGPEVLGRPPRAQVGGDDTAGAGADEEVGVGGVEAAYPLESPGDAGVVRHADRPTAAEDNAYASRSHGLTVADVRRRRKSRVTGGRARNDSRCPAPWRRA